MDGNEEEEIEGNRDDAEENEAQPPAVGLQMGDEEEESV